MIIDTMVFAYALFGVTVFREEASAVLATVDVIEAPDSLRAELANVAWQWVQHRGVSLGTAIEVLRDADALINTVIPGHQIWERALELAVEASHPVYDTMFVAAAELVDSKIVTFDRALTLAFADHVVPPNELVGN